MNKSVNQTERLGASGHHDSDNTNAVCSGEIDCVSLVSLPRMDFLLDMKEEEEEETTGEAEMWRMELPWRPLAYWGCSVFIAVTMSACWCVSVSR